MLDWHTWGPADWAVLAGLSYVPARIAGAILLWAAGWALGAAGLVLEAVFRLGKDSA